MSELSRGPEVIDHADLEVSPEERQLVLLARQLAYEKFAPRAATCDRENRFPAENFDDLRRHGFLGLRVPAAFGGKGASSLAHAAVTLEIAKGDPATALCFTMHCTAMTFLEHLASHEQRQHFYALVVRDGALFSALGSEPQANIFSGKLPGTTLTRTRDGYLVRGRKAWCSLGGRADFAFVNTAFDGAVLGVVVPLDAPNVRVHEDWDTLAMRGTQSVSIDFEDVLVPERSVIRTPLNLLYELEYGVGLCASYLGVAESAYRHARELARETVKRIVASPVGHGHPDAGRLFNAVGEMKMAIEPAWLMIQRAARTGQVGSLERTWALAEAKYVVGETAARVTAQAMRVAGAKGLNRALPVERLFRDAQAGLVMAIKPENAAYLAGRFELGILPDGMAVDARPSGFAVTPEALRKPA